MPIIDVAAQRTVVVVSEHLHTLDMNPGVQRITSRNTEIGGWAIAERDRAQRIVYAQPFKGTCFISMAVTNQMALLRIRAALTPSFALDGDGW